MQANLNNLQFISRQDSVLGSYLPVPRFSTASTSASTSATENGLLVLRCESSLRLGLGVTGTTASDSKFIGGTGTNALESETAPSVISFVGVCGEDMISLMPTSSSTLATRGGLTEAFEIPESIIGVAGDLEEKTYEMWVN